MTRILKWTVPIDDNEHPIGFGPVVHVAQQDDDDPRTVQVWTAEPDGPVEGAEAVVRPQRVALIVGTGQPYDGWAWTHAGTVIDHTHGLVWHCLTRSLTRTETP